MQYNITCHQYNEKSRWENIKLFSEFVGDM